MTKNYKLIEEISYFKINDMLFLFLFGHTAKYYVNKPRRQNISIMLTKISNDVSHLNLLILLYSVLSFYESKIWMIQEHWLEYCTFNFDWQTKPMALNLYMIISLNAQIYEQTRHGNIFIWHGVIRKMWSLLISVINSIRVWRR